MSSAQNAPPPHPFRPEGHLLKPQLPPVPLLSPWLHCFHSSYHTLPSIMYSLEHKCIFYACPFPRVGPCLHFSPTPSPFILARTAPGTEWQLNKHVSDGPGLPASAPLPLPPQRPSPTSGAAPSPPEEEADIPHLVALWGHPQLLPQKPLTVSLAQSLCACVWEGPDSHPRRIHLLFMPII